MTLFLSQKIALMTFSELPPIGLGVYYKKMRCSISPKCLQKKLTMHALWPVLLTSIMIVSDATIRNIIQQVVSNKFSLLLKIQK